MRPLWRAPDLRKSPWTLAAPARFSPVSKPAPRPDFLYSYGHTANPLARAATLNIFEKDNVEQQGPGTAHGNCRCAPGGPSPHPGSAPDRRGAGHRDGAEQDRPSMVKHLGLKVFDHTSGTYRFDATIGQRSVFHATVCDYPGADRLLG